MILDILTRYFLWGAGKTLIELAISEFAVSRTKMRPIALTIAGSDSGGGAGVQADLKTFLVCGVHGTSVITGLTAQNPGGVSGIHATPPQMIHQQFNALIDALTPQAIKLGALFNAEVTEAVGDCLASITGKNIPVVIDPVIVATSGALLLEDSAITMLKNRLLPLATIVTPNVHEAQFLTSRTIDNHEDLRETAKRIAGEFGCACLLKGGHFDHANQSVDVLANGGDLFEVSSPRITSNWTHGTGCTLSASIAAELANGSILEDAVYKSKKLITRAIKEAYPIGPIGYGALNPSAE